MKLLDFYRKVLKAANILTDDQGLCSVVAGTATLPFTIDGKRLVLPTSEHLSNPDKSGIILFHPLSENIMADESKILSKYRAAITVKLNASIGKLIENLIHLGNSPAEHSKLKPDQIELLGILKDVDEKSLINFQGILKTTGLTNQDKSLVHIFLKQGGKVKNKTYQRACIVKFGLYKELIKKEKVVCGVTLRKKDTECFIKLLEYVLPGIEEDGFYNRGSESDVGPFMDALMKSVMHIAGNINRITKDLEGFIAKPEEILMTDDWVECFDNLAQFLGEVRAIPMQAGNQGAAPAPVAPPAAFPAPGFFNPPSQQPAPQPQAPAIRNANGTVDFKELVNRSAALQNLYNQQNSFQQPSGPTQARNDVPAWAKPSQFTPVQNNGWSNQPGWNNQNNGFGRI